MPEFFFIKFFFINVIMYIRDLIKLIKPVKYNLVILNLSYDSYTRFKKQEL